MRGGKPTNKSTVGTHWTTGKGLSAIIVTVLAMLVLASTVLGQGGYSLAWWAVSGGAGLSSGGGYTLVGGMGRPDAGALSGGDYTMQGGFLPGVSIRVDAVRWAYLPVVMKGFSTP